ncbi:hypothetical protein AA313_de0205881 [Arthrobotrys entomopaga]|nr:hypothetical protein AA313_de0205881 [Arthrobotrys entomopaga]
MGGEPARLEDVSLLAAKERVEGRGFEVVLVLVVVVAVVVVVVGAIVDTGCFVFLGVVILLLIKGLPGMITTERSTSEPGLAVGRSEASAANPLFSVAQTDSVLGPGAKLTRVAAAVVGGGGVNGRSVAGSGIVGRNGARTLTVVIGSGCFARGNGDDGIVEGVRGEVGGLVHDCGGGRIIVIIVVAFVDVVEGVIIIIIVVVVIVKKRGRLDGRGRDEAGGNQFDWKKRKPGASVNVRRRDLFFLF